MSLRWFIWSGRSVNEGLWSMAWSKEESCMNGVKKWMWCWLKMRPCYEFSVDFWSIVFELALDALVRALFMIEVSLFLPPVLIALSLLFLLGFTNGLRAVSCLSFLHSLSQFLIYWTLVCCGLWELNSRLISPIALAVSNVKIKGKITVNNTTFS